MGFIAQDVKMASKGGYIMLGKRISSFEVPLPDTLLVGMSTEIQVAIETILPDQSKFIANQISCFDCFDKSKSKSSTLAKRVLKLDS